MGKYESNLRKYESSSAVNSAISFVSFLAWAGLIVGILLVIIGIGIDEGPGIGIMVIAAAVSCFVTKGILQGLLAIVTAAEIYIAQYNEQIESSSESSDQSEQ